MISNKPISRLNRKLIAVGCVITSVSLLLFSWFKNDTLWYLSSGIIGIPLLLLSISLVIGNASKNKGILSPLILNFIGLLICVFYAILFMKEEYISPLILIIPMALFGLAASRK